MSFAFQDFGTTMCVPRFTEKDGESGEGVGGGGWGGGGWWSRSGQKVKELRVVMKVSGESKEGGGG